MESTKAVWKLPPRTILLILNMSLFLAAVPIRAQHVTVIHGTPGVANRHAVASFLDLAEQERLHPQPKRPRVFPEPRSKPARFHSRAPALDPDLARQKRRPSRAPVSGSAASQNPSSQRFHPRAPVRQHSPRSPRLSPTPSRRQLRRQTPPAGATKTDGAAEAVEPDFVGKPRSPSPSASFLALLDDNTSIPPDTQGAVGPNHLMTTLNSQVRIQAKNGTVLSTVSTNAFFAPVIANGNDAFDPHCYYDPFNNRWIFSCDSVVLATSTKSAIMLAVSQTSDPTGKWNFYSVTVDPTDATWGDFPILGFNKNWIVVSFNVFTQAGSFSKDTIYAFNKANLYAGGAGSFTTLNDTTGGFSDAPALVYDNTLNTEYLVDDWNGDTMNNQGQLRISTITGAVGSEVLTTGVAFPTVSTPWSDSDPGDFAPQLGTGQLINTGDSRLYEVVYRFGSLWTAHTINLPASNPTRSAVQWWQLAPDGTIQQVGRLDDPTGVVFRAYPSVAVNANQNMLIGYSEFSSSIYASAYYAYRTPSDPPNTLEPEVLLKAGEQPYFKTNGGSENRWGDFSNTLVDPSDDLTMWTIQEYAASPANTWGTWWGEIPSTVTHPGPYDFNGDGHPDLLFQNSSTGQLAVWFMNGTSATPIGASYVVPTQNPIWRAAGVYDFNKDGHPDILFQNTSTGQLALWYMSGTTATGGQLFSSTPPPGWLVVSVNDFNGDGYPDLLLQNQNTGQLAMWLLNGTTVTSAFFLPSIPPRNYYVVGSGDVNGDGKPDIILQNPNSGQLAVWYMNGTTVTGAAYITPVQAPGWFCVAVVDLNGDGKPDLVFRNTNTGQLAYWLMNGPAAVGGGYFNPQPPAGWSAVAPR